MRIEIQHRPSYAVADVHLGDGEAVISEGGAMVCMSTNVSVETSTFSRGGGGGLLKAAKRLLAGENFFLNKFTASGDGHVSLAPTLIGDIEHIQLDGGKAVIVQGSSFLAGSTGLDLDTQFAGFKGLFSGENIFWIKVTGTGDLLVNSFGGVFSVDVDGEYVVDTGHIVAYEESLEFKPQKVGGWKATLLSGEGLVCKFTGKGKLWMQTHNAPGFGQFLGAKLPPRER
ncbi:MAG: TIGR00266 family protein [Candidatus Lernaella stagnicola]|nr:TIGR00266 family protein [Candidatus Lernaella stagnicola]